MKRLLLYVFALATLLAVALSAGQWNNTSTLLEQHAEAVASSAEAQELAAVEWAREQNGKLTKHTATPPKIADQDNTIFVWQGDSILFWSNSKALPFPSDLINFRAKSGRSLVHLPAGWFLLFQEPAVTGTLSVLTPLRYTLETTAIGPFPANVAIPHTVQITDTPTDFPVVIGGKAIAWLRADGVIEAAWLQWAQLFFLSLFFIILLTLAYRGAVGVALQYGNFAGLTAVIAGVAVILVLNRAFDITGHLFDTLPAFSQKFSKASWLADSPGNWLLGIALLAWAATFFQRQINLDFLHRQPENIKVGIAAGIYTITMLLLIGSTNLFQQLVFYSNLDFDFDNLLNNQLLAVWCIAGTLVLLITIFQIGQTLAHSVQKFELTRIQRGIALGVATVAGLIMAFFSGNAVHPLILAGFAVLFSVSLDVFVHWQKPGFGWTLGWLLMMSLFSATSLYRAAAIKDRNQRMIFAEALTTARDPNGAEIVLPDLLRTFERDSQKLGFLLKPWPFKAEESELRRLFNTEIFRFNYLFQHYRLNVYAFDRQNEPLLINQNLTYDQAVHEIWEKSASLPDVPGVRYQTASDGVFRYMIRLGTRRMGDPTDPATVYCFLEHAYPKPTRVYARLFYSTPYKSMEGLRHYDFAVQRNGRRVVEQGLSNVTALSGGVPAGAGREVIASGENRVYAVYKSANGNNVAVVGRNESSLYKPLFLFSVLFTLASVALLLLVLANSWLNFLPLTWSELLSTKGSLAKRIHYGIMGIVGIAFLVIGLLTYRNFTQAARNAEQENLDFRAEAILANLKSKAAVGLSPDSLRQILPVAAREIAGNLSMDVNLYNTSGDISFSTREDLMQLGILPSKMNPIALEELTSGKTGTAVTTTEQVAGVAFSSRYSPLYDAGNKLAGFLETPSDLKNRKPSAEISDFIGALAALYVFFLLVAYVVTMFLADSIIRPVTRISERIVKLDFENKDIPLEYDGDPNDELSGLVRRYNQMVDNLDASKNRIVKLEREGAWKEMARQVAHDIKNPLTTMKLSMQQLERVSNNPEQAAAYLRKAITRLIEQIDSLAQIASEFSLFANLDIKNKTDILLNNVVESVYDLFSEQRHVTLELSTPKENFHIIGDKNHLIRVFNNLIINAIQAIPSDRQGHIKVSLKRQDNLVVVVLSDNGGGIPPEIRDRVFEPNFTTKTSGSGLGLAICKKIIEAHDGDIRFETRDNEGTDFFVEFPIAPVEKAGAFS